MVALIWHYIKIWQSESPYNLIVTLYGHTDIVNTLAVLPVSSNIVSGSSDTTIKIWQSEYPYNWITTLNADKNVKPLALLTNLYIKSGSTDDATLILWRINIVFNYRNKLEGHIGSINDLKFINNSDLASCSSDNSIRIWDINTSQVKSINLAAHNRSCLSLCLFNYVRLVSSSEDKAIKFSYLKYENS